MAAHSQRPRGGMAEKGWLMSDHGTPATGPVRTGTEIHSTVGIR